jgi:hypothetical protein
MLRSLCLTIVKVSAVVVCVGVGASACVARERVVIREEPRHEGHGERHHDERHEERH